MISFRTEEKAQVLEFSCDNNIPDNLRGDEQRLSQVIMNLISNAVKFTPEGGEIRLGAALKGKSEKGCEIEISVSDTGIGISDEQKERLFQPFVQAESSTSRKYGGTGLGLAISRRLVEMMGGAIILESIFGEGSTFRFTAVFSEAQSPVCQDSIEPDSDIDGIFAGKQILIAEDIEINREIAEALLEPTGAEITGAENGQIAVDVFFSSGESFDLILMDVQMPIMDGLEAARTIRSRESAGKRVPIVAMTANAFQEDVERCIAAGMDSHIGKPIDPYGLVSTMKRFL
jgi:CheY-like chemotaxis protein